MKERNRHIINKRGMSLIETMVAMTVLTIVMLSVFKAFNFKIKADKRSGMRTHAVTLAENRLEELFKFPSSMDTVQLNNFVEPEDFISTPQNVENDGTVFVYHGNTQPSSYNYVFHRKYTVGTDPLDNRLRRFVVEVRYGKTKDITKLPFKVVLTTSKGVLE